MKFTLKHRRWLLGIALAFTLTAVASIEDRDALSTPSLVQPVQAHRQTAKLDIAELPLQKLHRQPLPENAANLFVEKSWHVAPPPQKAPPPAAPSLPFAYIGKLAQDGEKLIVMLSKQERSYTVSEGMVIDNLYRVDEIHPPRMTLTYLPLNIQQTIQIGELN